MANHLADFKESMEHASEKEPTAGNLEIQSNGDHQEMVCDGCKLTFSKIDSEAYLTHVASCNIACASSTDSSSESCCDSIFSESNITTKDNAHLDLKLYEYSRKLRKLKNDKAVDLRLIISILELIHLHDDNLEDIAKDGELLRFADENQATGIGLDRKGAVLVFLSGWADISKLIDLLEAHETFGNPEEVTQFHSLTALFLYCPRSQFEFFS